ncbi:MAG TPA: hypothetical protein VMY35_03330 [Phycisphaerae bacterium]|nr:hypothetical protein [Phycisphaerae bacterium]
MLRCRARAARTLIAAVLVLLLAPAPARAWNDLGHALITAEAVERLPEPLRTLLSEGGNLRRLQDASAAPDQWRAEEKKTHRGEEHYTSVEKPKHFFDMDALAEKAGLKTFSEFPRARAEAERIVGAEALDAFGRGPWAAADALEAFASALADGRTDDAFRQAGALVHYAADLHMPFHTTRNYDGQETGNPGIHAAVEVGLVKRYQDFYAERMRDGREEVAYLDNAEAALFEWLLAAHGRVRPILDADAAARTATGYDPGLKANKTDLDDLASERATPYYRALQDALAARGHPVAAALRDASADTARLLYTAYVRAGKPLSLAAVPRPKPEESFPWSWGVIGILVLFILLWPARRPRRRI